MKVIGLDLGGTKLAGAVFSQTGELLFKQVAPIEKRRGKEVGRLVAAQIKSLLSLSNARGITIAAIGISVPGIYYATTGKVWAPNIPGWTAYPLLDEIMAMPEVQGINVRIDSDRAAYILGEAWQGAAKGCKHAIFLAIGTGIGAGILIDGQILRGHQDIAGAVGWISLNRPFRERYQSCGCFEYHASGEGLARAARELLTQDVHYSGLLKNKPADQITAPDIFAAYQNHDPIATRVLDDAIVCWGIAVANLVSIFNPEKIIFGGGVFGPAAQFIHQIKREAERWAQPISFRQVELAVSTLAGDAGLIGAGRLAFMARDEVS
jgi:glucokinase